MFIDEVVPDTIKMSLPPAKCTKTRPAKTQKTNGRVEPGSVAFYDSTTKTAGSYHEIGRAYTGTIIGRERDRQTDRDRERATV